MNHSPDDQVGTGRIPEQTPSAATPQPPAPHDSVSQPVSAPGVAGPAFTRPQPETGQQSPYAQQNPYGAQPPIDPYAPRPQQPKQQDGASPKRRVVLPVIAALAVGAVIGGVSGGIAGTAVGTDSASTTSSSDASPANITVNDGADATIVTAVAASAGPSVVTISVSDSSSDSAGTGSGVILSDDGYVLTNTHVVTLDGASAAPTVTVQTSDGRIYQADVVGTDPIYDLAVIRIQGGSDFQPAEFADSSELNVGDTAVAIGAPLGLSNTVTNGIVSALNRSITVASSAAPSTPQDTAPDQNSSPFDFWQFDQNQGQQQTQAQSSISLSVIQTDAAINPGNSGGALLDSEGQVIGINVAIASAGQGGGSSQSGSIGVGFAIPSDIAQRVAEEIIADGSATHGLLGANVESQTAADATVAGAQIAGVTSGGAAQSAGLEEGDIVTRVGDIPITSPTDLTAQIRALAAGADTTITYVRDGRASTVDVTLGSLS